MRTCLHACHTSCLFSLNDLEFVLGTRIFGVIFCGIPFLGYAMFSSVDSYELHPNRTLHYRKVLHDISESAPMLPETEPF